VIAPGVGAFAEISSQNYAKVGLVASPLVKPADAKDMFTQRLYRSFGMAVHLDWARLLADRYRDLAEIPASTHQSLDGHHDSTPAMKTHPDIRPIKT